MFRRFKRVPKQAADMAKTTKDIVRKNRVSKAIYIERMNKCYDCVFLFKALDVCKKCGCFVKVKALSPSMECPLGKWSLTDTPVDAPKTHESNHDSDKEN